jgi:hypothetical protein
MSSRRGPLHEIAREKTAEAVANKGSGFWMDRDNVFSSICWTRSTTSARTGGDTQLRARLDHARPATRAVRLTSRDRRAFAEMFDVTLD